MCLDRVKWVRKTKEPSTRPEKTHIRYRVVAKVLIVDNGKLVGHNYFSLFSDTLLSKHWKKSEDVCEKGFDGEDLHNRYKAGFHVFTSKQNARIKLTGFRNIRIDNPYALMKVVKVEVASKLASGIDSHWINRPNNRSNYKKMGVDVWRYQRIIEEV